ncbi:MAG: hypothetical protein ACRDOI_05525 [Trebonia sp.]
MELTPGRQRLAFVVVVLALVGLGGYLIESHGSGGTPAAAPSTPARTPQPSASASSPGGTAGGSVPPSVVPSATPASTAGGAEIYQWLPFTAADLSAAAQTTTTFAKDYATWSYTESAAAYAAKLSPVVTAPELAILKNGYSTAGVAGPRVAQKQVSTGGGTIDSIRSFGTGPTITFVVTINQQVTPVQPNATASAQYAVTVVSSGGTWQVNDLELSQLGNLGNLGNP